MAPHIDMDTDAVRVFVGQLADAADGFESLWAGHRAAIGDGEAGIGADPLGQAFDGAYRRAADLMRSAADGVPPVYRGMSSAGHDCIRMYLSADRAGAGGFAAGDLA